MCVAAWPRGSRGWAAHDDNPSKQHSEHCQQFCRTLPCLCRAEICHQRFSSTYSMRLCATFIHFIFFACFLPWLNTKAKIRIASAVTSFSLEVHKIDSVFTGVLPTTCPPQSTTGCCLLYIWNTTFSDFIKRWQKQDLSTSQLRFLEFMNWILPVPNFQLDQLY